MMEKKALKQLELLNRDIVKNETILNRDKEIFINKIKKINKEDILPKPPEPPKKITLWQRLYKVLMG
jgi:hypothetical protein